ncbi:MAG: DUF2267 domain-containing protein [Rhizomicrobium sp.]
MSSERVESLDHSLQITHEWINELDTALGWGNKHRSYRLLGAVLQTLRDCLPLAEAAHLSAQLPIVLRGVYFEHWRPAAERPRHWDLDHFFAKIDTFFKQDPIEDVADAVSEVFCVLENRISGGEIDNVVGCLPAEIQTLWPGLEGP